MTHHPNCAISRGGDLRAYCDCGEDIWQASYLDAFLTGRTIEREKIINYLQKCAEEFRIMSDNPEDKWDFVSTILSESAQIIKNGAYYDGKPN